MNLQQVLKAQREELQDHIEADQQKIEELNAVIAGMEEEEVTYSIGDRFKDSDGRKWLIVVCGGTRGFSVSLSALDGGSLYNSYRKVTKYRAITQWEFEQFASASFTRYWDNRKQCKC